MESKNKSKSKIKIILKSGQIVEGIDHNDFDTYEKVIDEILRINEDIDQGYYYLLQSTNGKGCVAVCVREIASVEAYDE